MKAHFRKQVQETFEKIERALESIDPDQIECEQSQGSLILTLSNHSKCILSLQPSVEQLWLALASRGIAYHFDLDPSSGLWIDDKGEGVELLHFLERSLKEITGIEITI